MSASLDVTKTRKLLEGVKTSSDIFEEFLSIYPFEYMNDILTTKIE